VVFCVRGEQLYRRVSGASVEVKLKVKFTLKQAMKAQKWSRGVALPFLKLGAS